MARMIPGRIRNQGVALYEQGQVQIESDDNGLLQAKVGEAQVQYALIDDEKIGCTCDFFGKKQYCEHLAALECFLKNDERGREISQELESNSEDQRETKVKNSFGSVFLDGLAVNEDDTTKYRLSALGSQNPYASDYLWTLKMNRLPDERTYIVRDIGAFLTVVKNEGYYQIGKNYFEPISLLQFDTASQELIQFLWRIIPENDRLDLDYILPNHGRHLSLPLGFFEEGVRLLTDLHDFQFEGNRQDYRHLYFKELEGEDALFDFYVEVHRQYIELVISEKTVHSLFKNDFLLYHDTFYHLNAKQKKIVTAIKTLPIEADLKKHIQFDLDDQAKLAASLLDFKEIGIVTAPKSFDIRDFKARFDLGLDDNQNILLDVSFNYGGGLVVTNKSEQERLPFASNFRHEERIFKAMEQEGFAPRFSSSRPPLKAQELYHFFTETISHFERLGSVFLSSDLENLRFSERPQIRIGANAGLLDISFDFSTIFEGDIDEALTALFNNNPYFVSQSGQLVLFDDETLRVSSALQSLRAKRARNGHLQLDSLAAFQLSELFKNDDSVFFSKEFEQLAYDLRHPESFELPEIRVNAELRDYQYTGIRWLSMLDSYGFGGILADDMGLGKTLQTIAFLRSKLTSESRILILAPSSLIYNWQDEFHKFTPEIDVAVSYGLKPVRDEIIDQGHQVTITSYASFRQDFEKYQQFSFDYLILDEAQVMKNTQTKIAQYLRAFEVKNCFALSGTPIENKLLEIWSIFQIVLPGLLPAKKEFLKLDAKQVSRYIRPFVMRRKKEDVLPELPDLIEMNYPNELADSQKAIYLAQLRQMQDRIRYSSDEDINRHKIEILSGITRLRQICDTPSLFMDYDGESGKIDSLRDLLVQIKENGHRALIFSQFRGMLDIAEKELAELGLTSYKITGSTPANERQEMTRAFNNGSKDTFLISLKAGGVGLNLTGADTVVLIDLWWNPAVEMQAISRAHRIGQKENVEVYRLITRGTIEEKILELQESKKNLVTTVLDGDESRASMTIEDIKEILGIQSSEVE